MAGPLSPTSNFFIFIFFLTFTASLFPIQEAKQTHIVLYSHETRGGPIPTAYNVAGRNGTASITTEFGTVVVFDDPITDGPLKNESKEIGRFQGTVINSQLDGQRMSAVYNVLFTEGEFNGSTLQFQGTQSLLLDGNDEVSVVSGTRYFRFVRGYALLEFVSLDLVDLTGTFKLTITLKYDNIPKDDGHLCEVV